MSTHYTRPDAGAARAPFPIVSRDVTRYRSAAEICAAINAAADGAPEFSDACYAPQMAEWHGPTRGASFAHFLYCIDGARGSYSVSNTRENLLTLARKVNTIRAAFDGKPRRAPAAKRAPTSAPHVAARALLTGGNARDAIQLAENSGAVFFGAAAIGAPGVPYMGCETVEFFGHSFTIGRAIKTGRFLVLHTSTALSVSGSAHRDGFKTHSAALDWIETESACDAWREKFLTALHGRSEFDQTAARARYFDDETEPVDTIEPAPVETDPAETAPDAPMDPAAVDRMAAALLARFGVSDPAACAHLASFPAEFERIKSGSTEPAAIVPAADPAPAAPRAPADGDRFFIREWKPGTAHSWRSAAPSDAPRDYLVRQAIIAGYIGGAHRWAECAQTGAFLYGIGADTRPIHAAPVCPDPAPVDPAPRADAAPVDTGAAADVGPVESASTPGYAFSADALPTTHSDAAEPAPADRMAAAKFARQSAILEKLIRCDGQVMTRRAFVHLKIRAGLLPSVESHDRVAPMSRMQTFRASNEQQRDHDAKIKAAGKKDVYFIGGFEVTKIEHDYANEVLASMAPAADPAPVPGDSEPVPGKSDLHARIIDSTRRRILANPSGTAAGFDCERERLERAIANCGDDMPGVMSANTRALETLRAEFCTDPVPVNSAAPVDPDEQQTGETVETWFERIRRESAEKRARIAELAETVAAGSGSIGFTHPTDPERYGIAGPDMSGRGAFRFSYFDAAGPIGDAIRPSLADAIAAGVEYGFTVDAAPLEWPENPAPDAAPVATHSAPHPVPADTAPDDDTTPAPLDGLDVIETADAETLAEFDRLSRAPGVAQPASDARPIPAGPVLRIPAGDLRARIPARFAPAYLLTA